MYFLHITIIVCTLYTMQFLSFDQTNIQKQPGHLLTIKVKVFSYPPKYASLRAFFLVLL